MPIRNQIGQAYVVASIVINSVAGQSDAQQVYATEKIAEDNPTNNYDSDNSTYLRGKGSSSKINNRAHDGKSRPLRGKGSNLALIVRPTRNGGKSRSRLHESSSKIWVPVNGEFKVVDKRNKYPDETLTQYIQRETGVRVETAKRALKAHY